MTREELLQGVSVLTLPDSFWRSYGIPAHMPFAGTAEHPLTHKLEEIAVNQAFHTLTQRQQMAVLAHEMGHIRANHPKFIRDMRWECEADDYAVSLGYKEEMIQVLSMYNTDEAKFRIAAMRGGK